MKERDFQTQFKKHNKITGIFELKLCKGKSLSFSSVAEHQKQALLDVSSRTGLYHKISDSPFFKDPEGRMRFTKPKPFDCFLLKDVNAYVVIMFYVPRKKKNVYYIPIEKYLDMEREVGRKSFTEEMARSACNYFFSYLKRRN